MWPPSTCFPLPIIFSYHSQVPTLSHATQVWTFRDHPLAHGFTWNNHHIRCQRLEDQLKTLRFPSCQRLQMCRKICRRPQPKTKVHCWGNKKSWRSFYSPLNSADDSDVCFEERWILTVVWKKQRFRKMFWKGFLVVIVFLR